MPGIFQSDIVIKTAIELCMDDMRKNPWLIQDMLSDLVKNAYLKDKYGQKQIDACKEWLANNQIDIYLRGRNDKDRLPCVCIQLGESTEKPEMKTMDDDSTETVTLLPNQIGKPIPYVIRPFTPVGYDEATGNVSVPESIDLSEVSVGMILVNPANGTGYPIQDISNATITIEPNLEVQTSQLGVVPQFQFYKALVKHAFFEENHHITCVAHGDPQNVLFLWSIVKYAILRYRESLLEANGFAESTISSGGPDYDGSFTTAGGETAWTRGLILRGQVENTWIAAPKRIVESVVLRKKTSAGYIGGISIISNTDPSEIPHNAQNWYVDTEAEADAEGEDNT